MNNKKISWGAWVVALCAWAVLVSCSGGQLVYIYRLSPKSNAATYDEAMAVACLQGIINREGPKVYVLSDTNGQPEYWFKKFTAKGEWLSGAKTDTLKNLDELWALARGKISGAIIWDTLVPATVNLATTMAGVENGIVFSPAYASRYLCKWKLPVIKDLRGMFDGSETGSAKNDVYRWAIRNYLEKGLCYSHRMFLSEDAYSARRKGDIGYVVTRDWAVNKKSFVYDLSPWGDETPQDDPGQVLGTDRDTYQMILKGVLKQSGGKGMTEIAGFFAFSKYSNMPDHKSKHEPVPTEWESVYLMSPYNCYQNTVASNCFNQSFHHQAPVAGFRQHRPDGKAKLQNKIYICILMADYDSATPLYESLRKFWDDKHRGEIPFIWGINPNLVETYPDIIHYLYKTATANDYFGADASAAGYMNPGRVLPQYMPLFIKHNQKFFNQLDMTIAPMVLDWELPTNRVKDAFARFSPDGMGTIIYDFHSNKVWNQSPEVWKGMPVMELHNETGAVEDYKKNAETILNHIASAPSGQPSFYFFRIVWTSPSDVLASLKLIREMRPGLNFELTDPYTFNSLFKEYYKK